MELVYLFDNNGGLLILGDDVLGVGRPISTKRVSTIEPDHWLARLAFRGLRKAFGDRGMVAAWTRRWRLIWVASIPGHSGTWFSLNRQHCIDWERQIVMHTL